MGGEQLMMMGTDGWRIIHDHVYEYKDLFSGVW